MKVNISKKIGKSTLQFQVEGSDDFDGVFKASGFTTIPDVCGVCGEENVELRSNVASKDGKSFKFAKVRCLNCRAVSQAGKYADDSGIFWKPWEEFIPGEKKEKVDEIKQNIRSKLNRDEDEVKEEETDVETYLKDVD